MSDLLKELTGNLFSFDNISTWICVIVGISAWLLSTFMRGRRQLHNNLQTIEDALQKLQKEIEESTPKAIKED